MNVLETIRTIQLVPLIVLDDAKDAPCFARALVNGGIPIAEVTFRTAAAEETIRKMNSEVPDILVGAGTVHTCEQAQTAVNAGAQFIVTPGMNPAVVRWCQEHEVAVYPGHRYSGRSGSRIAAGPFGLQVFPRGGLWRSQNLKSTGRTVCGNFFYAHGGCQ